MSLFDDVLADLTAEGDQLRAAVAGLDASGWTIPVPAEGWTIATTVAHLLWTDEVAVLATDAHTPEGKEAWDEVVLQAIADPTGFVDAGAHELAGLDPADLLVRWDAGRAALAKALREVPDGQKMPWFGPPMSATSMATARFMETWAHALDVHDALISTGSISNRPAPTDRIKHVAHLGVRTRNYSFVQQGLEAPADEFRIELTSPSGDLWSWGPPEAKQTVRGTSYDFCQLVTQRIHRDDTDLVAVGADAEKWLTIAQAFAGPAGGGRQATA
ncbi:TIGR03084 family metal-binding protein [Nocardioides bizhenqiangii]|uniref:TIGR03084 family metal-binding protein n=1 Tax=Nocardioides bizhenqiangii TaxID=3095076 RepID=A0ABZ0ZS56_9ACTN|nr:MULTISPECIES: TIGR03084 family metal-binding protein [unclassified Nocardioides]MDZ5619258.1 TIGR03084 family metal-binding protein [Nocardioides sp. HM23]WQQ26719.1 TIGR03084 family metal-binding protein [Nocardioides sp. HM61]